MCRILLVPPVAVVVLFELLPGAGCFVDKRAELFPLWDADRGGRRILDSELAVTSGIGMD